MSKNTQTIAIIALFGVMLVAGYQLLNSTPITPPTIHNDSNFSDPHNLGTKLGTWYATYLDNYVRQNGAAISNPKPVPWCNNNDGIACNEEVSSEAVSISMYLCSHFNDKPICDRYTNYYYDSMQEPRAHFLMWKLTNNQPRLQSHQTSATDADLTMIQGLNKASRNWGTDDKGRTYSSTARRIMDGLKPGIVTDTAGRSLLPDCLEATSGVAKACASNGHKSKVLIGYLNIPALTEMCQTDAAWCPVLTGSKAILQGAIQQDGAYDTYYPDTGTYANTQYYVHQNWVLERLMMSGDPTLISAARPYYEESKNLFYTQAKRVCIRHNPGTGCEKAVGSPIGGNDPPISPYISLGRQAVAVGDVQFAKDLRDLVWQECSEDTYGDGPILCNPDNYGNVYAGEFFSDLRDNGVSVS